MIPIFDKRYISLNHKFSDYVKHCYLFLETMWCKAVSNYHCHSFARTKDTGNASDQHVYRSSDTCFVCTQGSGFYIV